MGGTRCHIPIDNKHIYQSVHSTMLMLNNIVFMCRMHFFPHQCLLDIHPIYIQYIGQTVYLHLWMHVAAMSKTLSIWCASYQMLSAFSALHLMCILLRAGNLCNPGNVKLRGRGGIQMNSDENTVQKSATNPCDVFMYAEIICCSLRKFNEANCNNLKVSEQQQQQQQQQ